MKAGTSTPSPHRPYRCGYRIIHCRAYARTWVAAQHLLTMKRILLTLVAVVTLAVGSAKALSYVQAQREAWFLTDKMAYELNLTSDQFDRVYQINLDYLMSIRTAADCYGYYWDYRDADFRCVLFDWQYALYSTVDYFFRPIRWLRSAWYFPVCDHYRIGYYYFPRPAVYATYRGGMWHRRGHHDVSPYHRYSFRPGPGMRDRYHAGGRPAPRPGHDARPGQRPGDRHDARPGQRPGDRHDARPGQRPGDRHDARPGQRPGDRHDARPGQRPGNDRPSARPGNDRPGGSAPSQRPGTSRPGNDRPSARPGNNRPSGGGTYTSPGRSTRPSRDAGSQGGNRGSSRGGGRQIGGR